MQYLKYCHDAFKSACITNNSSNDTTKMTYLNIQQHRNVKEIGKDKNWYDIHCKVFASRGSSNMDPISMRRANSEMSFKCQGYHHENGSTHGY